MFEEVGPFVYRESVVKENVLIHLDNTITYNEKKSYHFVPEMSIHDESFTITSINLVTVLATNKLRYFSDTLREVVNLILQGFGETLIIKKSVNEILFGYHDPILSAIKNVTDRVDKNLIPSDMIGLFIGVIKYVFYNLEF